MLYTSNTDARVGGSEGRCERDRDRNPGRRSRRHDFQVTPPHSEYWLFIRRALRALTYFYSCAMPMTTSRSTSHTEIPKRLPTISQARCSSERLPTSHLRRALKSRQMMMTRLTNLGRCRCGPSIISEAIAPFSSLVPRRASLLNARNRRQK